MPRKSKYSSLSEKLKREKKISPEFEVMLNTLTLEEVFGLRLELAAGATNKKFYGFQLFTQMPLIAREAVLMYAYLNCETQIEAATLLGLRIKDYYEYLSKFRVIEKSEKILDKEK